MKHILSLIFIIIATLSLSAQPEASKMVTGTVTDQSGETLAYVNVVVKGTTTGVICDTDGTYSIPVKDNSVLVFSYICYHTQEIVCGDRTVIDVVMEEDTLGLEYTPVSAYYTPEVKKYDMTSGTGRTITQKHDYRAMGFFNTDEFINGLATGIYMRHSNDPFSPIPGIRSGIGNIGGETKYMVNGVADAPFNFSDINSLLVIKGAPSAAVYGTATAPGGLVSIETENDGDPTFTVNAWVGVRDAMALLPDNDKNGYDSFLRSALVQHYDIKFNDQMRNSFRSLRVSGSLSYDKAESTVRGTEAQRLTPRLTLGYWTLRWMKLTQTLYYDRRQLEGNWLYKGDMATQQPSDNMIGTGLLNANTRKEAFSASTLLIKPWQWMDIKSVYTYNRIDTKGDKANANRYYTDYRNYFDFRNQENSLTDRWMWDNTVSVSHHIDSYHDLQFLAGFVRDKVDLKTTMPALAANEWDRSVTTNNMLLSGGYNYNYGIRTLSASIRKLSSSLPDGGDKDVYLPTVTAAWKFTEEPFMDLSFDFLDMIKIKGGWGRTAQVGLYIPVTAAVGYGYPDFTYSGLKWQVTNQVDAGTELLFFGNRLSLSADYYYKTTDHVLESKLMPSGDMSITSGRGEIVNRGWEFTGLWNGGSYKTRWNAGANLSINHSSVKSIPDNAQLLLGNYIAPKYNYGIKGGVTFKQFSIMAQFHGVADMYVASVAFATPFEPGYAKVNYFSLKSLNVSYYLPLRFIGLHNYVNVFANAENLLYITNSSLKNNHDIGYVQYSVSRMFSLGIRVVL